MVEAVRGVVEPVRIAHWSKPVARTKASTSGWRWASVHVIAFRKGKAADVTPSDYLDHIIAAPLTVGRRAELPPEVAAWMIEPFAVADGMMCDPWQHRAELEVMVEAATGEARDAALDALLVAIGETLTADPTLGGVVDTSQRWSPDERSGHAQDRPWPRLSYTTPGDTIPLEESGMMLGD
jgi:hypothetical protein